MVALCSKGVGCFFTSGAESSGPLKTDAQPDSKANAQSTLQGERCRDVCIVISVHQVLSTKPGSVREWPVSSDESLASLPLP